jgi:hypothetical protein
VPDTGLYDTKVIGQPERRDAISWLVPKGTGGRSYWTAESGDDLHHVGRKASAGWSSPAVFSVGFCCWL